MKERFELVVKDLKTGQEKHIEYFADDDWHDVEGSHVENPDLDFVEDCIKNQMGCFGGIS